MLLLVANICSWSALAVPPANDLCSNAIVIPAPGPFPYLTPVIYNISDATSSGDPTPSEVCVTAAVSRGIWYKFTPAVTKLYRLSLGPDTQTTVPDTVMAVFTSSGGCGGIMTEISCNDDSCLTYSVILTNLAAGQTYYIVVWKFGGEAPDPNQTAVQLHVSQPVLSSTPPANDLCSNAEIIPGSGPFPYLTAVADTAAATTTGDLHTACMINFSRSVWYRFRPETSGIYNFSTCLDTATTICDTVMAIYASPGNCSALVTNPIACSDKGCPQTDRAAITASLQAGTNYYIIVAEYESTPPTSGETLLQLSVSDLRPRFLSMSMQPNGQFQVQFTVAPGFSSTIQTSTNLTTWTDLRTISSATEVLTFLDSVSPPAPTRFYKIKSQ